MRTLVLFALLLTVCTSYKFLVYSPLFGHSHSNFLGQIADTLTEAGHDVTVLLPILDVNLTKKTGVKKTKKTILLDVDPRVDRLMKTTTMFSNIWTMSTSPLGIFSMISTMSDLFEWNCENLIKQEELLNKLKAEKFDAAIVEPFSFCGYGIMEHIGLKTVISAFSGTNLEIVSYYIGEPAAFSYVPGVNSPGEKMTLGQKLGNVIGGMVGFYMFNTFGNREGAVMKAKWGDKYSGHGELLGQSSFSIVNSNPYIDFPRPVLHKTIMVGGIAVDVSNVEKVDKEFDAILSERPQTVLISFGSIAKSKEMPEKRQILKVIESLPNTTFIWKYEEKTNIGDHLPNLHFSSWVPQKPLLGDDRLSLFITHGGLGSSNEVAYLGKPAIFVRVSNNMVPFLQIPLFADQPRNSAMMARHETAIVLKKEDLADANQILNAISTILNDKGYIERAKRLGEELKNIPRDPKNLVIKHCEFAARFGPVTSLSPYGRHLSTIEYYLIDVALAVVSVLVLISIVLRYFIKWFCCRNNKQKKE